ALVLEAPAPGRAARRVRSRAAAAACRHGPELPLGRGGPAAGVCDAAGDPAGQRPDWFLARIPVRRRSRVPLHGPERALGAVDGRAHGTARSGTRTPAGA